MDKNKMIQIEVEYETIEKWDGKAFAWVDIRNEDSSFYGGISGALLVPYEKLEERVSLLPADKKIVLYCDRGVESIDAAKRLRDKGFDAYSLKGGYMRYISLRMQRDIEDAEEKNARIELSIRKKFHKDLFSKFAKAINEYELLSENDHVAVCISGGKDSMLMTKLFQELKKHNKFKFELTFLVMDPGYSPENRRVIEQNAKIMNIPITIFESDIFDAVDTIEKSPCYLCARMRRGHLYRRAKELGCNKIALGHHYDDVIETILMGMLYGAQIQTMMPKLHSTNFEGMELIRPMYLIREEDIRHWRDYNDLYFLQCACHFTQTCSSCNEDGTSNSKRLEIKKLIAELKNINPYIEANIFKSVENVNLSTVIAYKENGIKHYFLEKYDLIKENDAGNEQ